MKYNFKALKKDNTTVSGTLEAADRAAAMAALARQNLHPLLLTEVKGKIRLGGKKKVKSTELVVFTRQFSTMISAGVPLARGLNTLKESAASSHFRQVIGGIAKDVEGGTQLGDAFGKYPSIFDDIYINMLKAGEEGGILDEILKRLATQVEQNASMKRKIKSAMTYPTVVLSITVVAFFGIMLILMPKMSKIIKDLAGPEATIPVYTKVLMNASTFMVDNVFIILPAFFGLVFGLRWYFRTPKGKYKFHELALKIPITKTIITKVAVARFSRTFSSLMSAGVGVLDSLRVTAGAVGNLVIEEEIKNAMNEVKNGKQLSDVIDKSVYFPKIVSQMLAVGEETGTTDVVLIKVADFYEEEVSVAIDGLASVLEPVMIVVLGGGVGLIAASVMGTLASLSSQIG